MQLSCRTMLIPLVLAFTVAVMVVAGGSTTSLQAAATTAPAATHKRASALSERELGRIHVHFDSVLTELKAANVSHLTKTQLHNRSALVHTLQQYNARGEFPHNYDFAAATPYFIDRKTGTLCAVAHLLESTGRRVLVDRVARTNNNVWVADLKGDAPFEQWLHEQGITLNEAARIQVPYAGSSSATQAEVVTYMGAVFVPLGATIGLSTWNALGNANGHSRVGAYAGLVSGVLTSGVGMAVRQSQDNVRGVRWAAYSITGAGALGVALATRALVHRPRYLAARNEAENARRGAVQTSISPIIPLSRDSGAGLSMSIRF